MPLTSWIAPIVWMAVVFWLSSGSFSAAMTGAIIVPLLEWLWPWPGEGSTFFLIHGAIRKLAHVSEYAILAILWWRPLADWPPSRRRAPLWLAFGIVVAWAGLDEFHQSLVDSRTGSAADVILDASGAGIALTALGWARGSPRRAAGFVLVTALVGSGSFLGLHYTLGVGPGWLWAIVAGALLLIALATYVRSSRLGVAALPPS